MNFNEAIDTYALLSSYNKFETKRSHEELGAWLTLQMPVYEVIPADFAQKYIITAAQNGTPVGHITEVSAAWKIECARRLEKAEEELIAPPQVADNTAAWKQWLTAAREAIVHGANPAQAIEVGNRAVHFTPALTPSASAGYEIDAATARAKIAQILSTARAADEPTTYHQGKE